MSLWTFFSYHWAVFCPIFSYSPAHFTPPYFQPQEQNSAFFPHHPPRGRFPKFLHHRDFDVPFTCHRFCVWTRPPLLSLNVFCFFFFTRWLDYVPSLAYFSRPRFQDLCSPASSDRSSKSGFPTLPIAMVQIFPLSPILSTVVGIRVRDL